MIFVNLLPDIKQAALRMIALRRTLVSLSIIIFAVCVSLCVVLAMIAHGKEKTLKDAAAKNEEKSEDIFEEHPDLWRILDLKYKVEIVSVLHEYKTEPERLFVRSDREAFLDTLVPDPSFVSEASFNFDESSFTLSGHTTDLRTAEILEKTIQYAGFEDCTLTNKATRRYPFQLTAPLGFNEPSQSSEQATYDVSGRFAGKLFDSQVSEKKLDIKIPRGDADNPSVVQPGARCFADLTQLDWGDPYEGGLPQPDTPADISGEEAQDANQGGAE